MSHAGLPPGTGNTEGSSWAPRRAGAAWEGVAAGGDEAKVPQ